MQRHGVAQEGTRVVVAARVRLEAAVQRLVDVAHEVDQELHGVVLLRAAGLHLLRVVQDGAVQAEVVQAVAWLQAWHHGHNGVTASGTNPQNASLRGRTSNLHAQLGVLMKCSGYRGVQARR